jgi:hypothetical protein
MNNLVRDILIFRPDLDAVVLKQSIKDYAESSYLASAEAAQYFLSRAQTGRVLPCDPRGCRVCGACSEQAHAAPNCMERAALISGIIMRGGGVNISVRGVGTDCTWCSHLDCKEGSCKEYHDHN